MIGLDKVEEKHRRFLKPWFHLGGPPAEVLAASASGDTNAARALLEREPQLATIPSGEVTPLRLAAYYGHREVAEVLLHYGAPVDSASSYVRNFPLHLAARRGHSEVVDVLIRHGADPNARDRYGSTPLLESARQHNPRVIRLLSEAGADMEVRTEGGSALQLALFDGSWDVVEELVNHGANVNAEPTLHPDMGWVIRTEDEWPLLDDAVAGARPLYIAVCRWSPDAVESLLGRGADINALSFGWSALHAAVVKPDHQMVELLLRRGADPLVRSDVNSAVGAEYNHRTPMDLLMGFRRSAQLLRNLKGTNEN
jgi:ankyrin repeat protein